MLGSVLKIGENMVKKTDVVFSSENLPGVLWFLLIVDLTESNITLGTNI